MTIEIASVLPLLDQGMSCQWRLLDPAQPFVPDYGPGVVQRVRYNTARWQATLRWEGLAQEHRHLMAAYCAKVGTHRAFWVADPTHNRRGSFPSTELIPLPEAAATWTGGTGRVVTAESGGVRNTRTDATVNAGLRTAQLSVTANATYALRAVAEGSIGTLQAGLAVGSTAFGTDYGTSALSSTLGRKSLRATPTTANCYASLLDGITLNANWTQQGSVLWRGVSFCRAFMADGGSGSLTQLGSALYVKGLTTSTAGLLKAGDMVELVTAGYTQMLRLTEDLNSDSGGLGYLNFEPAVRAAVSANDLIIPLKPMVRMCLMEDPAIDTRPGWYSDVELQAVEVFE